MKHIFLCAFVLFGVVPVAAQDLPSASQGLGPKPLIDAPPTARNYVVSIGIRGESSQEQKMVIGFFAMRIGQACKDVEAEAKLSCRAHLAVALLEGGSLGPNTFLMVHDPAESRSLQE